jgi:DNA processing protein
MVAPMSSNPPLNESERLERLRLVRTESIGPVTFRQLLARYGSAAAAIEALPALARRGARSRPLHICPRDQAERERDGLAAMGGTHVFPGEADYPHALAALDDAPMVLSAVGCLPLLTRDSIGIVGARNASTSGRRFARRMAGDLAAAGLVVVSGMARGIDAAAHAGALEATVAVLAGGVDVIYPMENKELYDEVRRKGLLVSEMPLGTQPQARHFPRRNRIISGLSRGVLVVEAALRSGSLITARLAAEQGRDVFAVPGSPLDPRCRGPNDLIRKGAILTESVEDILAEWPAPLRPPAPTAAQANESPHEPPADLPGQILDRLGSSPISVDDLIRDTAQPAGAIRGALLELELAGQIERRPGDFVARLFGAADGR